MRSEPSPTTERPTSGEPIPLVPRQAPLEPLVTLASPTGPTAIGDTLVGDTLTSAPDGSTPLTDARLGETSASASRLERLGRGFEATHLQDTAPHRPTEHGGAGGVFDDRYVLPPEEDCGRRELGRGGLGRVLVAVDRQLGREVAVKELLPEIAHGNAGHEILARFVREAKITGQLEHPNIVPVYEIGVRPGGAPYYTMRLVRGRTLADALTEAADLPSRLTLLHHFAGLCQAIAFAHSRGVIHRDIKPQNVMIGEFGETVVLDWGIAKVRGTEDFGRDEGAPSLRLSDAAELHHRTVAGKVMGTPAYMSPEQAAGEIERVDEQSDVWALGAVLYRLLTGRLPFEADSLPGLLDRIRSVDVARVKSLDPNIPSDLAAIAERALRCDASARYRDAGELLRDVLAFQSGARVAAYEYSSVELFRRFVAKNRGAVAVFVGAVAVLLGLGAVAYRRVLVARDRALGAEQQAQASAQSAQQSLAEAFADKARIALLDGDLSGAEIFAAKALSLEERPDARGIVVALSNRAVPVWEGARTLDGPCRASAYSLAGALWSCADERSVVLDSLDARHPSTRADVSSEVSALAIAPGIPLLAWGQANGFAGVWAEPARTTPRTWPAHAHAISTAAVSVNGQFAVTTAGSTARVWNVETSRLLAEQSMGETITAVGLTPDARSIVLGGRYGEQRLWQWDARRSVELERHAGTVLTIALSADRRTVATGSTDRTIRFYDANSGAVRGAPLLTQSAVTSVAWSPSGRYLASGGKDSGLRLHDMRDGGAAILLRGMQGTVLDAQFSDDSRRVGARDSSRTAMTWQITDGTPWQLDGQGNVLALAYLPSGGALISAGVGKRGACWWNTRGAQCETRLPVPVDRIRTVGVSPSGSRIALAGLGGKVFVWDSAKRIPTHVLDAHHGEVRSVSFSPDGRRLVTAGVDKTVRVWDVRTGRPERAFHSTAGVQVARFSGPRQLVTGNRAGAIEFWSTRTGQRERVVLAHSDWVMDLAVRGSVLASAGADGTVGIWDRRSGQLLSLLRGHEGRATSVDLSTDGQYAASASEDRTVRLWDLRSWTERARLQGHQAGVRAVRFAPDSRTVASGSDDGTVRLWALGALQQSGDELLRTAQERAHRSLSGTQLEMRR